MRPSRTSLARGTPSFGIATTPNVQKAPGKTEQALHLTVRHVGATSASRPLSQCALAHAFVIRMNCRRRLPVELRLREAKPSGRLERLLVCQRTDGCHPEPCLPPGSP